MFVPETEIIVSHQGAELCRKTVRPGEYIIGREPNCDVPVAVELVSRRHAQLTVNYDHVLIEDLGSSNGTFVNGRPVNAPVRLWPNQKVQIGAATIELRRVKSLPPDEVSLPPSAAAVQRLLPEELLREKRYEIGSVVAQGGMGEILNATDQTTRRDVAMKVMLSQSNAHNVLRFIEEAQVTAQLEHPNIVPVHELSVNAQDQVFYTMKYVRGVTLREVIDRLADGHPQTLEKYPLAALLTVFQKICDALAFAHSRGVIHRDLKPANIMLGDFGEVLVMDWGLAKRLDRKSGVNVSDGAFEDDVPILATLAGSVLGTPQYMAPEQAAGEVESLDARADIYALGAILFHLLALRPAVAGNSAREVVDKVARGAIDDLEKYARTRLPHLPGGRIPDSLVAVVRRAMSLAPAERYASVAALQADLAAYQSGFATSAENAGVWKQLTLLVRRHRIVATATVASLLLLTGVSAFYIVSLLGALNRTRQAVELEKTATQRATKALAQSRADTARADAERDKATAASERATKNATEADAQRGRAENLVVELRQSAPAFYELAQSLAQEQRFDEALAKLSSATALEPGNAKYLLAQAHLLQATEQLRPAAVIYEMILALPAASAERASAESNLAVCQEILRANGSDAPLTDTSRGRLLTALLAQGRSRDAVPLGKKMRDPRHAQTEIKLRLSGLLKYEDSFSWERRLVLLPNKSFRLDLSGLQISEAPRLTGLAISELILDGNQALIGLETLRGSALEKISANRTHLADLTPLADLPLVELSLQDTQVIDLAPLRRLRLKKLIVSKTPVADLSPLAELPLEVLDLEATNVSDLRPLSRLPLKILLLRQLRYAVDLSPLTDCRNLETLAIPKTGADLLGIRSLPLLRQIIDSSLPAYVRPEDYWAKRPPNALELAHLERAMSAVAPGGSLVAKPRPVWTPEGLLVLDLQGFPVTDLSPLRGLPITALNLYGVPITDFSPLAATPLKELTLGGQYAANFPTLKKLTTLTDLTIKNSPFRNLEDIAGLKLQSLDIALTAVTDLTPLRGTDLEILRFPETEILDIRPLLEMDKLRTAEISEKVTNATLLDRKADFTYGPKDKNSKPPARSNRRAR